MSQSDIINSRQIQWFPGHMTKTLRLMEKEIRNVDCVLQILDARIPLSSLNPEIERITAGKPHLYVLNKADLADPEITKQWLAYFTSAGAGCIAMDSKQRGRATATKSLIEKELSALMERRRSCPLRVAGSTLTANVAFAVLKYAALTAAGVLLFHWGQGYALAERGYKAIGGEALLLGLPLFWYLTETTIRDTVRDFRKGGRRK